MSHVSFLQGVARDGLVEPEQWRPLTPGLAASAPQALLLPPAWLPDLARAPFPYRRRALLGRPLKPQSLGRGTGEGQAFLSCCRDVRLCVDVFSSSFESHALSWAPRGPLGWPVRGAGRRGPSHWQQRLVPPGPTEPASPPPRAGLPDRARPLSRLGSRLSGMEAFRAAPCLI